MKLRKNRLRKRFLAPLIGLLFAFFLCFVNSHPAEAKPLEIPVQTPFTVLADIEDGTPEEEPTEEPEEETAEKEEDQPETCYDQVKGIGWLVCPTTGVLAEAVDSIYNIIEKMLVVQPMSTDSESPIFIVWQYVRDLTNIVFIILIIVVIYSQLTGVGFDNYNIKKILPKLIITAVLINLSYIICSVLVDASNIAGASLRGFFENVESNINATGDAMVTWGGLAAVIAGGGAVAGFAISASGGLAAFLWMLLPTLLAAALAIIVGLVTIAMRQAVVALLVMIAPLAFVCYMLPNTNKWFTKWKDTLASMLIFFPMFSALFGASHLAGWALIAKAQQDGSYFMLILGMAVQVIPLFLCWSLMKMSGSVLGTVSNKLSGLTNNLNTRARGFANEQRDNARARNLARASTRNFNPVSGASWAAFMRRQQAIRAAARAANEETINNANALHVNARRTGRRITGWDKNGRAIYEAGLMRDENGALMRDEKGRALTTDFVKINRDMREEYRNREVKLATDADRLKTDNAMSDINAYMRATSTQIDKTLKDLSKGQAQNYLELRTQQSAKSRNDRADQRFYFEQVQKASELNDKGEITNQRLYNQLVRSGAGADAYDTSANKDTIRQNALTTVTADAYEAFEKARKETTSKYTTYFEKQRTSNVIKGYDKSLHASNIDAITAAQDVLAFRGDHDTIRNYLSHFMDHTKNESGTIDFTNMSDDSYIRLGSDFSNVLAANLMAMKDKNPQLGRLGKFINMETWKESSGERKGHETVTFKEYVMGQTEDGEYSNPKTSMESLLEGTNLGGIERTYFGSLKDTINQYYTGADREKAYNRIAAGFLPQMISAIPNFETNGEQIMSTLNFLTGMKWDVKSNMWVEDGSTQIHGDLIEEYMRGLTDKDVNAFKTNTYQAICSAIAAKKGMTAYKTTDNSGIIKYDADGNATNLEYDENGKPKFGPAQSIKDEFRGMVKPEVLAAIQNNINNGTNAGMKPSVIEAFGLTIPKS